MNNELNSALLKPKHLWLMLFCQVANILTIVAELSLWMLAIVGLCLCWRALITHQQQTAPSKAVLVILSIAGMSLLVMTGKQLGLLSAMLHLLVFAYALKALELNSRKEFYQMVVLGIFILALSLIFNQTLYFAGLILLLIVINLTLLLQLFETNVSFVRQYKKTAFLIIQSLPLAIVLFIVFPKLPPFWKMPSAQSSITGISDNINIGDIANLALSDELAFRVSFEEKAPAYSQFYWRGLVLDNFDGERWQQANVPDDTMVTWLKSQPQPSLTTTRTSQIFNYQIYLEPSFQQWLFALDVAYENMRDVVRTENFTLYRDKPINHVYSYNVTSDLNGQINTKLSLKQRQQNLQLPKQSNPRLTAEGMRLRKKYDNNNAIIDSVLKRFNQQNYYYSLKPRPLTGNKLDQFYFDTRVGFCEYYATSFVYLMRAAGIPARVVVGYLGAELNAQAGYYSVYQRDAHAWAEIWQQGKGWIRVDPTAAVNPTRVEQGFSEQLFAEQANFSQQLFTLNTLKNYKFIHHLRLQLAAIDYQWTKWVIGYSNEKQTKLLTQWLGKLTPWKIAAVVATVLISMMLFLTLYHVVKHRSAHDDDAIFYYKKALTILAKKHDIERSNNMAAREFSLYVSKHKPYLAESFTELTQTFEQLVFAPLNPEQYKKVLKRFKRQIKQLKDIKKA